MYIFKLDAQIALKNDVSINEVRREIQNAIDIGMSNSNPAVQKKWIALCKNGIRPTPEELLIRISNMMNT